MGTLNRLTDLTGEGYGEKWKTLAEEHICIAHGHRQQCGEGGWGEVGDICNSVNNDKLKNSYWV